MFGVTMPEKQGGSSDATTAFWPQQNAWLQDVSEKLRARQTAWEGYQRADLISTEEVQMLRDAEQAGRDKKFDRIVKSGTQYVALYTRLFEKLSRTDTIQQVVLLTDDLLQAAPNQLENFLKEPQLYTSLQKLLGVQDDFVSLKGAQFLASCLRAQASSSSYDAPPTKALDQLLTFLHRHIRSAVDGEQDKNQGNTALISLVVLGEILREASFRSYIWKEAAQLAQKRQARESTVGALVALEEKLASEEPGTQTPRDTLSGYPQLQYQGLFALWVLTFDKQAAAKIDVYFELASVLAHLAQSALKHKVIRLIVGIWDNMLAVSKSSEEDNAARLLGAKVLPVCNTLQERNYSDEEMREQLKNVIGVLSQRLDQMSSYEEYRSELSSKHMSWDNPVHTLDQFWKENAEKLVDNNEKDLKQLVELLQTDSHSDSTTLAVACNDISKFVHFYDGGRRRVTALGAKDAIARLIDYDDAEVRHSALQTLARLVSSSWK
ncbi:H(+)-transporting V1 sector ATPase subunit H [Malassezia psittaci]|uniref:V-type proton ATPase subunit H n=1 Tax=Malassezia psittaci TaxID=1821823 RepID=A0AAF0F5M3_9BASI|nr:H(+)-transporting V1 sector ATPase subunit H [Malassezia psittaci]